MSARELERRIQSAVWGTALAVGLLVTLALPWASYSTPTLYLTLWRLRDAVEQVPLAAPAELVIPLVLLTVVLTLAAAASATWATSLAAGIAGAVTTAAEIYLWVQIGIDGIQSETGVHAAVALTLGITAVYLSLAYLRYGAERQRMADAARDQPEPPPSSVRWKD
jgi:hypothetical protein